MPTIRAIPAKYRAAEAKVKAILPNLLADIGVFQAAYFTEHGRYWQGLSTHGAVPDEKQAKAADRLDRAPQDRRWKKLISVDGDGNAIYSTEEDTTWRGTGIDPPPECAVSVSDYNGPQGHGYVVTCAIKVGEETVTVVRPYGPEAYRKDESRVLEKETSVEAIK